MLLDSNDVSVRGGEFRLLDCVIARLELRSVDSVPSVQSTLFAVITLGGNLGRDALSARTSGFGLHEVLNWDTLHQKWRKDYACGRNEHSFLEFLLRSFQAGDVFALEFLVEDGRMGSFSLRLDRRVQLFGRFPLDTDIRSLYFSAKLAQTD